jgi:molecular chaperone GrpE
VSAELPANPADVLTVLGELRTEVSQLRDLFARRLMDDKARNSLYESVQEQARAAQELLKYRAFETLFREALLAVDRLQSESATPELVESAVDELLEVFARRSLMPIDDSGVFDPRYHEAVATIPASIQAPPGAIVAVHRTGYLLDDRLLRPAQVTVAVAASDESKLVALDAKQT